MLTALDWSPVTDDISKATRTAFRAESVRSVSGGSINAACRLEGNGRSYFVKMNSAAYLDMFVAEAEGIAELSRALAIRVPEVVTCGADTCNAWLVCEYIPFAGRQKYSEQLLGEQLAAIHRHKASQFGWHRHNTIGSTFQDNSQTDDWLSFVRHRRLEPQLELAGSKRMGESMRSKSDALLEALPDLLGGHAPVPSLLHGDLWSGNRAFDEFGAPVVFDPAVYYGDRETDLAMTELFGGFGSGFYAAYQEAWPLDQSYAMRKTLYNLYHVLNHANLFGGGYLRQAEGMIGQLLAEVR